MQPRSRLLIVSPALEEANNGNWQTAKRWARQLASHYVAHITQTISAADVQAHDVMIALHARRSAEAVALWHCSKGSRGLVLALTGTDLYRDIDTDANAQRSLELAGQLIVLQELGIQRLAPSLRNKTTTIFQSTTRLKSAVKTQRHLTALMVGHLREEKMPQTFFDAVPLIAQRKDIRLRHIGASLDDDLLSYATKIIANYAVFSAAGAQNHAQTRRAIQRAHVLVHPSRMEGGAHVVMEAVCSGTPVLASRIDGNVGMLSTGYSGYFPLGDAQALAKLLIRCKEEPAFLDHLNAQCALRAPLFAPKAEASNLLHIVESMLK